MKLTQQELDEIRGRCNAASPGPWIEGRFDLYYTYSTVPKDASGEYVCQSFATFDDLVRVRNGTFIAHARQDVPSLLDHIAARDADVAKIDKALVERRLSDNRYLGDLLRERDVTRSNIKRLVAQVDRQEKEIEQLRSALHRWTSI